PPRNSANYSSSSRLASAADPPPTLATDFGSGTLTRRPAPVPVGHTLVRVPRGEHVRLGERPPDELEPDRPPVAREPARQRERRQPGQVEGTREAADRLQRAHLGVADRTWSSSRRGAAS